MKEISVVIPTYNRAVSLPRTVASVLGQTHAPIEVLIVDDGSTDDTPEVCRGFASPVRYIRRENGGVSAARNTGIAEARGEWIALADSDDLWAPEKLEVQLESLESAPDARWCASGCTVIGTDDQPVRGRQGFEAVFGAFDALGETARSLFARTLARVEVDVAGERHEVFHGDFFPLLFRGNMVLPSSAVIHRSLFDEAGRFDEEFRVAEETEFFHRASAYGPGAMVMSPLVGYRVAQDGSLTNPANTPRLIRNALTSLDRAASLRDPLAPAEREAYQRGRSRLLSDLAYAELSLLDGAAARDAVVTAWRSGAKKTPRSAAIFAASLLPTPALRGLHRLKRALSPSAGRG